MAVTHGNQFMLEVNTGTDGAPNWVVVANMNSFSRGSQRNHQLFPVFQRTLPHSVTGPREQTYSIGGYYDPSDVGQLELIQADSENTVRDIRITHDGTNGFKQKVKVTSMTYDADPEGLQEISFEFSADEAAVQVGTGPLL